MSVASPCLSEEAVCALADGRLRTNERDRALRHIEECDQCRVLVATFGASLDAASDSEVEGRYQLIEELGRGGMGVVYRAHDMTLQRDIALKLIHPGWAGDAERRARLVRESRAMAKLRHPNVAHVYDAGELDGEVFFAMELVEGQTLRQWLQTEREPTEILECFLQAGQGLAAAHHAGIVHRDFKPDNVLIDSTGRPLVTDFGLARTLAELVDGPDADGTSADAVITRPGTAAGTPAYMAPEQVSGEAVDAKADVFAFCVALWEALYGLRPFAESSVAGRRRAIDDGEIERGRSVGPRRVRAALRAGLRGDPSTRSDLATVLAALEQRTGRRWVGGMATLGVLGLGILAVLGRNDRVCPDPPSTQFGDRDQLEEIRARLLERSPTRGALRWTELEPRLIQARTRLDERHAEVCRSDELGSPAATAMLRCIDLEARVHETLFDIAADGNTQVLHALEGPDTFDFCELATTESLLAEFDAPSVLTGHDDIAPALAMDWGSFDDRGPIDMAQRMRHRWPRASPIVMGRALLWDAVRLDARGDERSASIRLRRAYATVAEQPVPYLRFRIAMEGVELDAPIDEVAWYARADAALAELPAGLARDRAQTRILLTRALDALLRKDGDEAERLATEALAIAEHAAPGQVWRLTRILSVTKSAESVDSTLALLRVADDQFGMRSPQSFEQLSVIVPLLADDGRLAEAYELADEALERASDTLVEDSATALALSGAVSVAALLYARAGRGEEAIRALELADQARLSTPGRLPARPTNAVYRCEVMRALRLPEALEHCSSAWRAVRQMPEGLARFMMISGIASVMLLTDAGRTEEAVEVVRQMDRLPGASQSFWVRGARAYVAVHVEQYDAALAHLDGAAPTSEPGFPFQPEGNQALADLIVAEARRGLGQAEEAREAANAAIDAAPETSLAATSALFARVVAWRDAER